MCSRFIFIWFCWNWFEHGFKNQTGLAGPTVDRSQFWSDPINWTKNELNRDRTGWTSDPTSEPNCSIIFIFIFFTISKRHRFGEYKISLTFNPLFPSPSNLYGAAHCRQHGVATGRTSLPQWQPLTIKRVPDSILPVLWKPPTPTPVVNPPSSSLWRSL